MIFAKVTEDELKKTAKIQKVLNNKEIKAKKDAKGSGLTRYSNLKASLVSENKKSSSNSGSIPNGKLSKESLFGQFNYNELKNMFETQIANRQYQLSKALILQSEKRKVNNWDEITRRLNKVLRIDIELKKNISRIVKTHLMISNAFLGFFFVKFYSFLIVFSFFFE